MTLESNRFSLIKCKSSSLLCEVGSISRVGVGVSRLPWDVSLLRDLTNKRQFSKIASNEQFQISPEASPGILHHTV